MHIIPDSWQWNGRYDKPTITPSLRITGYYKDKEICCHFNITDGQLVFHSDSVHSKAGQTVEMSDWPK
jgi:hypothetical protein